MKSLKVNYIGIKNILGIKRLEYKPGKINAIDGANGVGKTSFLKAIQGVVGGGHDATLLRKGTKEGEIVLVLDNGMKLSKKIGDEKSKVTLKDEKGRAVPKAASFLKDIIDTVGLNPIQLLTASAKDRVDILMDSIPMKIPDAKIREQLGVVVYEDDKRHPFEVLECIRKDFFESRATVNRELKDKTTMVENMRETLPFDAEDTNYSEELARFEKKKDAILGRRARELEEVDEDVSERVMEITEHVNESIQSIKDDAQRRVDDLREKAQAQIDGIRKGASEKSDLIRDGHEKVIEALTNEIGRSKELVANESKIAAAKGYIQEGEKQIDGLQEKADKFSEKLEKLADIKKGMLADFPIEGMEIKDGQIYLDGVVFDQVNEARKIQFALDVAGLRETELPLVCVDGLESLDKSSFDLFCEHAKNTKMQFFVTRVTDEDQMSVKKVG